MTFVCGPVHSIVNKSHLNFHVTHAALTVEAFAFEPQFTYFFMTKAAWFVPKMN